MEERLQALEFKYVVLAALATGCLAFGGSVAGNLTSRAVAATTRSKPAVKAPAIEFKLRLRRAHTQESLDIVYRRGNHYIFSALGELNQFLRDYRTGQEGHYAVQEFDLLYQLMQRLHRPNGTIEVLCGYRSPATNAYLRSRIPATGAAENSMHMQSKAIDIRVPGVTTEHLRDVARSLHMGGVGYYPEAKFVHVDVGPVRQWTFDGGTMEVAGRHKATNGQPTSSNEEPINGGAGTESLSGR
jgi:uncharacterized protein YcbK (DUF882 family)